MSCPDFSSNSIQIGQYVSCLSNWSVHITTRVHLNGFSFPTSSKKILRIFCCHFQQSLKYRKFCYSYDKLATELHVVQFGMKYHEK